VDVSPERWEELLNICDSKTRREISEAVEFLEKKGLKIEPKEAQVVDNA